MTWRALLSGRAAAWAALVLLVVLALPPMRAALEASMRAHMLVQFPLIALAGYLLAGALPPRWSTRIEAWNAYGIAGLLACALVLSVLMIPRLLDLALVDGRIELLKALSLLGCGAAVRLSWRPAGLLVQGFFLGNVLPMTAAAGQLYQDSPLRLCNAYLLDDQVRLGEALVLMAVAIGLAWLVHLFRVLVRREAGSLPPAAGVDEARP